MEYSSKEGFLVLIKDCPNPESTIEFATPIKTRIIAINPNSSGSNIRAKIIEEIKLINCPPNCCKKDQKTPDNAFFFNSLKIFNLL